MLKFLYLCLFRVFDFINNYIQSQASVSKQSNKQHLLLLLGKDFLSPPTAHTPTWPQRAGGQSHAKHLQGSTGTCSLFTARPSGCTLLPETTAPTAGLWAATWCCKAEPTSLGNGANQSQLFPYRDVRYFTPAPAVANRTRETFLIYTHPFAQHLCFRSEARSSPVPMQQHTPQEEKKKK